VQNEGTHDKIIMQLSGRNSAMPIDLFAVFRNGTAILPFLLLEKIRNSHCCDKEWPAREAIPAINNILACLYLKIFHILINMASSP
jgi:hypothetical protein